MKSSTQKESSQTDRSYLALTLHPLNLTIDPTNDLETLQELVLLAKEDRVYSTVYKKGRKKLTGFVVTENPKDREEAQMICDLRHLNEQVEYLVSITIKTLQ